MLPAVGPCRLADRYAGGLRLEMSDRSLWEVSPGHEVFTADWVEQSDLVVVPGTGEEFPYDLIHPERGQRVPARFTGFVEAASGWTFAPDPE